MRVLSVSPRLSVHRETHREMCSQIVNNLLAMVMVGNICASFLGVKAPSMSGCQHEGTKCADGKSCVTIVNL